MAVAGGERARARAREWWLRLRLEDGVSDRMGIEKLGLDGALYTSVTYWAFTWVGTWATCCVLRGAGWRGSGSGTRQPSPSPPFPTGTAFLPNVSPWRLILLPPHSLIEEFTAENRGSGPR